MPFPALLVMAAHVADITAVSSCKTARGTSCCQHPAELIDKGLIIKLSKAFLVSVFCSFVGRFIVIGTVSQSSLKKCFQFVSLQLQLGHYASVDKIKANTRQQLLVVHLEDG